MSEQLTWVLDRVCRGESNAAAELFPLVYEELRRLAARHMSAERPNHTLQATALVHEVYVRLVGDEPLAFQSRAHFSNAAAEAMRRILVDHARNKAAAKRGGGRGRVDLERIDAPAALPDAGLDYEALDRAMMKLQTEGERPYRVVMLRYFAGLSQKDTAATLDVSIKTVQRDWAAAKLFLFTEMRTEN